MKLRSYKLRSAWVGKDFVQRAQGKRCLTGNYGVPEGFADLSRLGSVSLSELVRDALAKETREIVCSSGPKLQGLCVGVPREKKPA